MSLEKPPEAQSMKEKLRIELFKIKNKNNSVYNSIKEQNI